MKAILGAMLGIAITVSPLLAGQEPAPEKEKQKQDEPKKHPSGDQQQEPQAPEKPKPEKPQQPTASPKKQKPDDKQQQQDKQKQKQATQGAKKTKEKQQGQSNQQNNTTQQSAQASHGKGQRIPPEKFQSNFGSQHHFRVQHLENGRRFQHGGYWFELVEVWPTDWSYDDDCYIEEDAGDYYVVDLFHPGVRVSVIVIEG